MIEERRVPRRPGSKSAKVHLAACRNQSILRTARAVPALSHKLSNAMFIAGLRLHGCCTSRLVHPSTQYRSAKFAWPAQQPIAIRMHYLASRAMQNLYCITTKADSQPNRQLSAGVGKHKRTPAGCSFLDAQIPSAKHRSLRRTDHITRNMRLNSFTCKESALPNVQQTPSSP